MDPSAAITAPKKASSTIASKASATGSNPSPGRMHDHRPSNDDRAGVGRTRRHRRRHARASSERSRPGNRGARQRRSCLLYTSDAADERSSVDLGGRRIIKKKKK